jgi:hypothetical protein
VNKYTVYTYTVCKGREGIFGHRRGGVLKQIKHLPQSPITGQFFLYGNLALLSIILFFLWLRSSKNVLPVAGTQPDHSLCSQGNQREHPLIYVPMFQVHSLTARSVPREFRENIL